MGFKNRGVMKKGFDEIWGINDEPDTDITEISSSLSIHQEESTIEYIKRQASASRNHESFLSQLKNNYTIFNRLKYWLHEWLRNKHGDEISLQDKLKKIQQQKNPSLLSRIYHWIRNLQKTKV